MVGKTITTDKADELIAAIAKLSENIAVVTTQLRGIEIKFDRQENLNTDVEQRMKAREIHAERQDAKIQTHDDWQKTINGILVAVVTTLVIMAVCAIGYLIFGGPKP